MATIVETKQKQPVAHSLTNKQKMNEKHKKKHVKQIEKKEKTATMKTDNKGF